MKCMGWRCTSARFSESDNLHSLDDDHFDVAVAAKHGQPDIVGVPCQEEVESGSTDAQVDNLQ